VLFREHRIQFRRVGIRLSNARELRTVGFESLGMIYLSDVRERINADA
jgi:hypothetical protein